MKIGNIGVDFDGTLDKQDVQEYIKELINIGYNIYVITSREDDKNKTRKEWNNIKLYEITNYLNIPKENIIFCAFEDKHKIIKEQKLDIIFHLDDTPIELALIDYYLPFIKTVNVRNNDWKLKCEEILNNKPIKIQVSSLYGEFTSKNFKVK